MYGYVAGTNDVNQVKSVRTRIEWMNSSNVCGRDTSYSITIVRGRPEVPDMAGFRLDGLTVTGTQNRSDTAKETPTMLEQDRML